MEGEAGGRRFKGVKDRSKFGGGYEARIWHGGKFLQFGSHKTPQLAAKARDLGLYKLKKNLGLPLPEEELQMGTLTDAEKADIDSRFPTLQSLVDHHKEAGIAARNAAFQANQLPGPQKLERTRAGPSRAASPEAQDGEMADDEESDWEELQGYITDLDICSDSDDDMAGLKPVEPNPAYQDWPPRNAEGKVVWQNLPVGPLDIPDGGLESPSDEDARQVAYEAAMLHPDFREHQERLHNGGSREVPLHLGLDGPQPSAEKVLAAWRHFGQTPIHHARNDRKPWKEAKAFAHLMPLLDQEELSEEEDYADDLSKLPGGLRYQYQVDRKARAEGRPQDSTPEVLYDTFWAKAAPRSAITNLHKEAAQLQLLKEAGEHGRARIRIYLQSEHFKKAAGKPPGWGFTVWGKLVASDEHSTKYGLPPSPEKHEEQPFTHYVRQLCMNIQAKSMKQEKMQWGRQSHQGEHRDRYYVKGDGSKKVDISFTLELDSRLQLFTISPQLAQLMGTEHSLHIKGDALTKLMLHIRAHGLQDASGRVRCDPLLKGLFGCDEVDRLDLPDLLQPHLTPIPPFSFDYNFRPKQGKKGELHCYDIDLFVAMKPADTYQTRQLASGEARLARLLASIKEKRRNARKFLVVANSTAEWIECVHESQIYERRAERRRNWISAEQRAAVFNRPEIQEMVVRYLHTKMATGG